MKEIKLSQRGKQKGLYVALVDDEDYEYLNQFKWCAHKQSGVYYAVRTPPKPDKKTIYMHRVIMHTSINMQVDHIDHDGLNNQKANLRNCTKDENTRNRRACGSSKYLGVYIPNIKCKDGIHRYIVARISVSKNSYYLGTFSNEIEAAKAYDNAAKKHFGEFANLNFK